MRFHNRERTLPYPVRAIEGRTECRANELCELGGNRLAEARTRFVNECWAVGGDRREKPRIKQREPQRAITSHGNAANAAGAAPGHHAIAMLDVGHEFADEKTLVIIAAIQRIDVKAVTCRWRDDQKLADAALAPKVLNQIPAAGIEQDLRVFVQAVKKIEDGEAPRFIRIVAWRQQNAVWDGTPENFAAHGAAFGASCAGRPCRHSKQCTCRENEDDCNTTRNPRPLRSGGRSHAIHTGAPRWDSASRRGTPDKSPQPN